MANFFVELKRRHIYRVGAAYVVVAWALTQLVEILAQVFTLPLWLAQTAIVLLALGFPIALIVAWTIESKPHETLASTIRSKPMIVDWALFGAVAVLIALTSYQQLMRPSATSTQTGVEASREAAASLVIGVSLAVLPFANLSSDPEQEFFSDGITEEITTALARVPDLRVVARTSAFEFKGQNRNIQTIGQQLQATHLIEGSVRKEGDRVRITAQLIRADDGTHVWAESFDRQLTNIFAIQEEIARAITASLQMPLGLRPGENLVNNRNIDPESYQQYLLAKVRIQARDRVNAGDAVRLLEQIVVRSPDYAPAWSSLALAYYLMIAFDPSRTGESGEAARSVVDTYLPKMEVAANRAIQLDPNLAAGHLALSDFHLVRGNMLLSMDLISKAFTLDPNDPEVLALRGMTFAIAGQLKQASEIMAQLRALEPFVPAYSVFAARSLWLDGQTDAAIQVLSSNNALELAMIYASMGRFGEAVGALENSPQESNDPESVKEAVRLLRMAPAGVPASPRPRQGNLEWVYLYTSSPERALEGYEFGISSGFTGVARLPLVWHGSWAGVRKTERFKTYVRALGLVDYWRVKGWPEFCRAVGADDFVCG